MTTNEPGSGALETPPTVVKGYFRTTRTAWYGFLMAIPLIFLYEVMIRIANAEMSGNGGVRIGSEIWLKNIPMNTPVGQWVQGWMLQNGIAAEIGMLVIVALVGLGIYLKDRPKRPLLKLRSGLGVVLESGLFAFVFAFVVSHATAGLMELMAFVDGEQRSELSTFHGIALSLGAGIYEELLFRVIITGGLFLLLNLIMPRFAAYMIAAFVGAVLFSWVHFTGSISYEFTWQTFTYLALGGLFFNALFLARGFGVAAWTHALYDVYLDVGILG